MQRAIHSQFTSNLHTHSHYCGHGSGEISDYVAEAERVGLTLLGFSEHAPFVDNRYTRTRMDYAQLPSYEADVEEAQSNSKNLTILLGYECDYHRVYHNYLSELAERVDYLIGGVHYLNHSDEKDWPVYGRPMDLKGLHRYADRYCAMLQSGLFLFGVHPDLFYYRYRKWDSEAVAVSRAIIECALSEGVALEINGYGLQKRVIQTEGGLMHAYPSTEFWSLAAEYSGIVAVTSSDAHKSGDVGYGREETALLAQELGLTVASYAVSEDEVTLV